MIPLLLACSAASVPAIEACNGVDDDGDGAIDEDFDQDGDLSSSCGWVSTPTDCNDLDARVRPGAIEACDGLDDDCDGVVPPGEQDLDADGSWTCAGDCDDRDAEADGADRDGDGWTTCAGDCDDDDPTRRPGSFGDDFTEACNGLDDDCDGALPWWDADNDGDGQSLCDGDCDDEDPSVNEDDLDGDGASGCDGDCDDLDAAVGPAITESCDLRDDDCDGEIDEIGALGGVEVYLDGDGDGYGSNRVAVATCTALEGYAADGGDCDDGAPEVYPGAPDTCGDRVDQDCDGADDRCAPVGSTTWDAAELAVTGATPTALVVDDVDADGAGDLVVGIVDGVALIAPGRSADVGAADGWWIGAPSLGAALVSLGDVDADGGLDVAMGAPDGDGAIYIAEIVGTGAPVDVTTLADRVEGDAGSEFGGQLLAGVGTLWGSGPDLVAGFATPTGRAELADRQVGIEGETWSFAVGDVDGTGVDDAVVAGPEGVGVFRDPSGDLLFAAADALFTGDPGDDAGAAVALTDLDGDGTDDLVIGGPGADDGDGVVAVFYTLTSGAAIVEADATIRGPGDAALGSHIAAGDVDADGLADLLLGADAVEPGGAAWLCYGAAWSTSLAVTSCGWTVSGGAGEGAGQVWLGDVDADGHLDVWVGGQGLAGWFGGSR